ncbi:MAG: hypothetical protein INQ03_09360 [Candidatus Heimdallarchaeota archaeon]|nr:hypothetical protein [Candidatus Heimdallarchaeota archaeon]
MGDFSYFSMPGFSTEYKYAIPSDALLLFSAKHTKGSGFFAPAKDVLKRLQILLSLKNNDYRFWSRMMDFLFLYDLLVEEDGWVRLNYSEILEMGSNEGPEIMDSVRQMDYVLDKEEITMEDFVSAKHYAGETHLFAYEGGMGDTDIPWQFYCLHPLNLIYLIAEKAIFRYSERSVRDYYPVKYQFDLYTVKFLLKQVERDYFEYFTNAPLMAVEINGNLELFENYQMDYLYCDKSKTFISLNGLERTKKDLDVLCKEYRERWTPEYLLSRVAKENQNGDIFNKLKEVVKLFPGFDYDEEYWKEAYPSIMITDTLSKKELEKELQSIFYDHDYYIREVEGRSIHIRKDGAELNEVVIKLFKRYKTESIYTHRVLSFKEVELLAELNISKLEYGLSYDNEILDIPSNLDCLTSVTSLILSVNEIPVNIGKMNQLTQLEFRNATNLMTIPDSLYELKNLRILHFYVKDGEIKLDIEKIRNLKFLYSLKFGYHYIVSEKRKQFYDLEAGYTLSDLGVKNQTIKKNTSSKPITRDNKIPEFADLNAIQEYISPLSISEDGINSLNLRISKLLDEARLRARSNNRRNIYPFDV